MPYPSLPIRGLVQAQLQGLRVRQGDQEGQEPFRRVRGGLGGTGTEKQGSPQGQEEPQGPKTAAQEGSRDRLCPGARTRTSAASPTRARKASGSAAMGGKVS